MPETGPLVVMGAFHGRTEPLGGLMVERLVEEGSAELEATHIPESASLVAGIAHRLAWDIGVRCIGTQGELGGHFPGDINSDNTDRRQAAWLHQRLMQLMPWLILDSHGRDNTATPGDDFVAVNRETTPAALAAAHLFGIHNVIVYGTYPYLRHHPQTVGIDQQFTPGLDDPEPMIAKWLDVIAEVQERGPTGMAELYDEAAHKFDYYQMAFEMHLIRLGYPDVTIQRYIEQLELSIPDDKIRRFAPVDLDKIMAQQFGIEGLDLRINTWNYANNSPVAHGLGRSALNGVQRRELFADGVTPIAPPKPAAGGKLKFDLRHLDIDSSLRTID